MTFLFPLGLLWLASIPVLIWLWRFAATRHQTLIPSLIPFEHLLRRRPTRRTRLLVNILFWLQLAALALLTCVLAEPVLIARHARTTLVVLDTSASMASTLGGPSAFEQAQQFLLARLRRHGPGERVFVVTTAPVLALTPQPVTETADLSRVVERLATVDLGGNLSVARRIGQSLLGARPDVTLVLTDEPSPSASSVGGGGTLEPDVEFHTFGNPLPNAAIVGVDAYEPLCLPARAEQREAGGPAPASPGATASAGRPAGFPSDAQLLVSVQHVAEMEQDVTVSVQHDGRVAAEATRRLSPQGRARLSFSLPEGQTGRLEVILKAARDALSVDNRAFITLRGAQTLPLVVASDRATFLETMGRWLDACPRVAWKPMRVDAARAETPHTHGLVADLLVTDDETLASTWPSSAILFGQQTQATPLLRTQWLVDSAHPIGDYLKPLDTVVTALAPSMSQGAWGDPVIWGVAEGRKIPLVRAASLPGRRVVRVLVDPTRSSSSIPVVMVFLNSLRWLTASFGMVTTGEPLLVGPFEPGLVRIQPPHGAVERRTHEGGRLRDDATDRAGLYRFTQGDTTVERAVNFLNPIESNTMTRVSTWGEAPMPRASSSASEPPRHSIANWLLSVLVLIVLLEWLLYSRRGRKESIVHSDAQSKAPYG